MIVVGSTLAACSRAFVQPTATDDVYPPVQDLAPVQMTVPAASLSTPQLIDSALARGEISSDQRLLYLAYAIYEYDALPAEYHSQKRWDATLILRDLNRFASSPDVVCNMPTDIRVEFQRLMKVEVSCSP